MWKYFIRGIRKKAKKAVPSWKMNKMSNLRLVETKGMASSRVDVFLIALVSSLSASYHSVSTLRIVPMTQFTWG